MLSLSGQAAAGTIEKVLYNFGSINGDGASPEAAVIVDASGRLYGTTAEGGIYNGSYCSYGNIFDHTCGTVFKLSRSGTETVLYTFCQLANCADGANPVAGLIADKDGNLYGTTYGGGSTNEGTVFRVTKAGREKVLYSFTGRSDGGQPHGSLIFDRSGNLYGTTAFGGDPTCLHGACGTVFMLAQNGTEKVVHEFEGGKTLEDGARPYAGMIFGKSGDLFGTTIIGGNGNCDFGCGTVFEISANGTESLLYSFTGTGFEPAAGLVMGKNGDLYGTTFGDAGGCVGTAFVLSNGQRETLKCFRQNKKYNCARGCSPWGGFVFDGKEKLYGTTSASGKNYAGGTVFSISHGVTKAIYSFCTLANCSDGSTPYAALTRDSNGNLLGTTSAGGRFNAGTVFKIKP